MASRNAKWLTAVHAVQREHGCDFQEAKRIYASGNGRATANGVLSIDALTTLAQTKCDELHSELDGLHRKICEVQEELARWGRVREAALPPVAEVRATQDAAQAV